MSAPLRDRYDIRWVPPEQMHLSVLFAGDVSEAAVDAIAALVEGHDLPTIELRLQPFGVFPQKGIPRVVWAGLGGDVDAVRQTKERLEEASEPFGVAREKRAFTPHVTLGRVKSPFGALALIDQLKELSPDIRDKPFTVQSLTLYESRLTPQGPHYEVVARRPSRPSA